ncbi:MAG: VOC family protein [Alphaproteobacteria bacterium]|nr:VOC family protein [Alphaproteobacteria bacterium]
MPDLSTTSVMRGVIAYLAIDGADAAMRFYGRAFDAKLWGQPARDDKGRVLNASLLVNGGVLMLMDAMPEHGSHPARAGQGVLLQLVSLDGEAMFTRAVAAGCTVIEPFERRFWGDRWGLLRDPFGLDWAVNEPSAENQALAATITPQEIPS